MEPELTKGLLESVEFANDRLADCAAVAKESHCNADGKWDSEKIHEEFQACLRHCFRLECFARSLAVVLRRGDREREKIQQNPMADTALTPHEKRYSIVSTLEVPTDQSDIKRCLEEARKAAAFVASESTRIRAHIHSIQQFCEHPKSEQVTAKDYSGCSSTLCKVCGLDR